MCCIPDEKAQYQHSIKTQGWINNKLTSIVLNQDNAITVYFHRGKGCKCPQSIYKYPGLLKEAVNTAALLPHYIKNRHILSGSFSKPLLMKQLLITYFKRVEDK